MKFQEKPAIPAMAAASLEGAVTAAGEKSRPIRHHFGTRLRRGLAMLCIMLGSMAAAGAGEAAVAPTPAQPKSSALSLRFAGTSLMIQGLSPGGSAVVLNVSQEPAEWTHRTVWEAEVVPDEQGMGRVSHDLDGEPAATSVWVVIDLENGAMAAISPNDISPQTAGPGAGTLLKTPMQLDVAESSLVVMVARPQVGAWWRTSHDGAAGDDDQEDNGQLVIDLGGLQWIGAAQVEPPVFAGLVPGDVVVGVDPIHFEHFMVRAVD